MIRERPTFCGKDCGANACPLLVTIDGDRALRLRANPAGGPYLRPCPRGYILHRAHHAPDRLRAPLIAAGPRGSGLFREASWDEALDLVAKRLADIRRRRGANSVLAMGGAGSTGAFHDSAAQLARFLNALRPAGAGPEEAATFLSSSYSNEAAYRESGLDDGLMRGVACLHEGAWLDPAIALREAAAGPASPSAAPSPPPDPKGSTNILSSTEGSGPAIAPAMHGLQVIVSPLTPAPL
jgi:anaerobic selenocysteine-containing dehydrogenase